MRKSLGLIYHNLALMLEAGVPMLKSLRTVADGGRRAESRALQKVVQRISEGSSVAEAMALHPKVFDRMDVLIIGVGETSGSLSESFEMLSHWHAFAAKLVGLLKSGMILPFMYINAAAFITPLPKLIMGRINLAGYLLEAAGTLALVYVPTAVILGIIYLTPRAGPLRVMLDTMVLRLPVLGMAVRQYTLSRFCQSFYMMLKSGVPATQAIQHAVETGRNYWVTNLVKGGIKSAKEGHLISEGFSPRLALDFRETWRVGEETGMLDDASRRLGQNAADRAERYFTEFFRWVPRLVYFYVCVILIFSIFSVFYQIGEGTMGV